MVEGRVTCPTCRGAGRLYDRDERGDPCTRCREDGYLDPADDGYPAALGDLVDTINEAIIERAAADLPARWIG